MNKDTMNKAIQNALPTLFAVPNIPSKVTAPHPIKTSLVTVPTVVVKKAINASPDLCSTSERPNLTLH